jgi:seryl-tRNA synthetase
MHMLDIEFVRGNKEVVEEAMKNKKGEIVDLDNMLALFDERKSVLRNLNEINQKRNEASKERDIEEGRKFKEEGQELEEKARGLLKEFVSLMSKIPNIPSVDTPIGPDESGNKPIREWGEKPNFDFEPKDHIDLGTELDIIDTERASKTSGARFAFLKGDLALMQFALVQLVFETLTNKDTLENIAKTASLSVPLNMFTPMVPPVMVKPEILNAMGRLEPKDDKYFIESDNMYLVGSAEHSIGPMYAEEVLKEEDLPLRFIGYSTAFRREAGSYGKDTKGILRVHQFDKLEMETFCMPGESFAEQDFLVAIQEYIMQQLKLPYQVVLICTGDMGIPDQRQIDIETWMPAQGVYRETHSADLIGAYQPRRLNTRVKRKDGKTEFVHMNDATALAIGRTLIAILENYQQRDGSVQVPTVLQKYVGKTAITAPMLSAGSQ